MNRDIITIFVSSPGDVYLERKSVDSIVKRVEEVVGDELNVALRVEKWELLSPSNQPPQQYINSKIRPYDIFLGMMWNRFGTPTDNADSGTEEEFKIAYDSALKTLKPEIMFYFRTPNDAPKNSNEASQLNKVLAFKEGLSSKIFLKEYFDENEFKEQFREDLEKKIKEIRSNSDRILINDPADLSSKKEDDLIGLKEVRESGETFRKIESFSPISSEPHKLNRIKIHTTRGWIDDEELTRPRIIDNNVYLINDPVRPYVSQIGETRSKRNHGHAAAIPDLTNLDLKSIKDMYPFLLVDAYKWIRMVLAELSTDPKILNYIYNKDPDSQIKNIVARNPSADVKLQEEKCIFCDDEFIRHRMMETANSDKTRMIHNDFPYGPYFHYIAFPKKPIHAWEDLELEDITDLNKTIWDLLNTTRKNNGWNPKPAGCFIGLNSTIKHLVLGTKTLTSAGASIPHIHKQIWGMAPGTNFFGDYLKDICEKHEENSIDYLGEYLKALSDAKLILHENDDAVLYVPFGQIAVHELQIMMKNPGKGSFINLNEREISSLSELETLAIKCLKRLGIHSFNEVTIGLEFNQNSTNFRLILCFITREIDFAVSELNMMFVVDKHPESTRNLLAPVIKDILDEMKT